MTAIQQEIPHEMGCSAGVGRACTCAALRTERLIGRIHQMGTRAPDSRHPNAGSWCPVHDAPRARFECAACWEELATHATHTVGLRAALRWALARLRAAGEAQLLMFTHQDWVELELREQLLAETAPGPLPHPTG